MASRRPPLFTVPGRIGAGIVAIVALLGVLLTPTASDAAPRRTTTTRPPRTTTTTTVVEDAAANDAPTLPADAVPNRDQNLTFPPISIPTFPPISFPPITIPNIGDILANVFASIRAILAQVFARLCQLLGGSFCSSP